MLEPQQSLLLETALYRHKLRQALQRRAAKLQEDSTLRDPSVPAILPQGHYSRDSVET